VLGDERLDNVDDALLLMTREAGERFEDAAGAADRPVAAAR
jgi:hypothetical protein